MNDGFLPAEYSGTYIGGLNNLLECSESARLYFMRLSEGTQGALWQQSDRINSEKDLLALAEQYQA